MSNMRHKQKNLRRWLNPEKVFLSKNIILRLREFDIYAEKDFKRNY